jgi:hypothetical protein
MTQGVWRPRRGLKGLTSDYRRGYVTSGLDINLTATADSMCKTDGWTPSGEPKITRQGAASMHPNVTSPNLHRWLCGDVYGQFGSVYIGDQEREREAASWSTADREVTA